MLRDVGRGLRTAAVSGLRHKSPHDVVSDLDLRAEAQVIAFLSTHYPEDRLLSEESASSVEYASRVWVLDPLDGTVNRTTEVPFFGVSLALLEAGRPTEAYVYDPVHDELFSARAGQGAFLNGKRMAVSEGGVRGIALTSSVLKRLVHVAPDALVQLLSSHGKLRNFGAQALHLSYVAAGRLHAAVSVHTRLWDNLAGALLVREAGGCYSDLAGRDPFPLAPGDAALRGRADPCIASSPGTHAALVELLRPLTVGA